MKLYRYINPVLLFILVTCIAVNSPSYKNPAIGNFADIDGVNTTGTLKKDLDTKFLASYDLPIEIEDNRGDKIVEVALKQLGNAGGEKFWRWYGLGSRVAWCAIFISYCADQLGYIDQDIIPRFASVPYGVNWFKSRDLWLPAGEVPKPGMIVFFDFENFEAGIYWVNDGSGDHVGFVEYVEDGYVHCIEGNNGDTCKQTSYPINSQWIMGYGTPQY